MPGCLERWTSHWISIWILALMSAYSLKHDRNGAVRDWYLPSSGETAVSSES